MRPGFRSLTPPLITILALSAGMGCDTEAKRQRLQAEEESARRRAETESPTPQVLAQIKAATDDFMQEHHQALDVESTSYTALTPNLFLVGVSVRDRGAGNRFISQLTAERLRDVEEDWNGDTTENGTLLWVIDYASEAKMKALAQRHGFEGEVDAIRREDPEARRNSSWGRRSWIDDYLLWHFLFNRPAPMYYGPNGSGMAFRQMAPGYRFQDPARPIQPEDASPFKRATAATGGRSTVFLGGSAWRPPLVSQASGLTGQAFVAHGSGISGKAAMGSVSHGGFGAAGRAAGGASGG